MSWSVAASLVFGSNSAVVAFMAFDSAVQEQRALISGKVQFAAGSWSRDMCKK